MVAIRVSPRAKSLLDFRASQQKLILTEQLLCSDEGSLTPKWVYCEATKLEPQAFPGRGFLEGN